MGVYIPNMKAEQFYELCKQKGIEIIAIPVDDVRPVVRGEWKKTERNHLYSLCPVCREPYAKLDVLGTEQNKNFCPNCGADMREES